MSRLLFVVEDTFEIAGRGLVPVPGNLPVGEERFRVGDRITLMRPDNTDLVVEISGLEMTTPNPRKDFSLLLKGIEEKDIPIGTEVWSIDNQD